MIHKILKILDTTDLQEIDKQRITTDLLSLFNSIGRSGQLCRCGKPEEKAYSPCCSLTCWCEQFE